MPNRQQLPPNPPNVRIITDSELDRLKRKNQNLWHSRNQTCFTCGGKGWFKSRLDGEVVDFDCNCLEQMILSLWFTNAGLGAEYQKVSWDNLETVSVEAAEAVLDYIENSRQYVSQGKGLIFHGSPGTGKTLLATLMLKSLMVKGFEGQFFVFTQMLDAFAQGWSDQEDRDWFYKKAATCPILVIDDIGQEANSRKDSPIMEAFDIVVQNRINSGLPTFITTNLTADQIEKKYKKHIFSRLTGSSKFIEMNGNDFRPQLNERKDQDFDITYPLRWT